MKFQASDPWLLQTVIFAAKEREASLRDLIATGDAINHAIFTFAELEGGLGRLIAAGYVEESDKKIRPTNKALVMYDRLQEDQKSVQQQRESMRKILDSESRDQSSDPGCQHSIFRYSGFTENDLLEAEQAYRKGFSISQNKSSRNR